MKQIEQIETTIDGLTIRPKQLRPNEVLALNTIVDLEDINKAEYSYAQIEERVEVKIAGAWVPLKEKDVDLFHPDNVEHSTLFNICVWMMSEVIRPVFWKSKESKK